MEQRLIDANEMMMRVNGHGTNKYGVLHDVDIRAFINEQPTVDAVQVVRCRECIHQMTCGFVSGRPYKYRADWFCADGERRTDEQQT